MSYLRLSTAFVATAVLAASSFAQDECISAAAIVDGPNGPFTNVGATDSPEPWPCGGTASADLWYSYVASCTGTAQAQTCTADFDTKIEVFDGVCGALTSLICNDDSCGVQSSVQWSTTLGTTYYIRVGGFNGATGNFPLDVTCNASVANDTCATAIPVGEGVNGPFSSLGATSTNPFTCVASGGSDVWFSYTPTRNGFATVSTCGGNFDTCIEAFTGSCGALTSIACNDDFCTLQSSVSFPVINGTTYYIEVGGFSAASGNFPLEITNEYGLNLIAVAEATLGSGTLSIAGGSFTGGDTIRWNFDDLAGNGAGKFAAVVANFGICGAAPTGTTPGFPGFNQVWDFSTPIGLNLILNTGVLPALDQSAVVPFGIFYPSDTLRLQGLVIDPVNAPGFLPLVATENSVQFAFSSGNCMVSEGFETVPVGTGNYPTGWSNGGGTLQWIVDANGTPSGGTGPSSAIEGLNYMYCETSSPATTGSTWIMNTAIYPSAGARAVAFQLSRVGDAIGTLEVRMGDGTGTFPTVLGTYTGPGPAEWTKEVLGLCGPLSANVQFQFNYSYGGGFRGDIAIDEFCIEQ